MTTVFMAVGYVLIVEGLVYALAPSLVEDFLMALRSIPPEARRLLGLVALSVGLALILLARMAGT